MKGDERISDQAEERNQKVKRFGIEAIWFSRRLRLKPVPKIFSKIFLTFEAALQDVFTRRSCGREKQ